MQNKTPTSLMCPRCHIGELANLHEAEDESGVFIECMTCGYFAEKERFITYSASQLAAPISHGIAGREAFYDFPLEEGIKFWRETAEDDSELLYTNVPHWFDDGTGFEWGYGGSGPMRFSLNILETVFRHKNFQGHILNPQEFANWQGQCFFMSWHLVHKFKDDFICVSPKEGSIISIESIVSWMENYGIVFG